MNAHALALLTGALLLAAPGWAQQQEEEDRPALAVQFRKADRNGDGRLTKEEVTGRRAALVQSADADGDGAATLEEIRIFLAARKPVTEPDPDASPIIREHPLPEEAPVTLAQCRGAAEYSADQNGYSFLVLHKGKPLFERYDQGWTPEAAHRLASGTKSFSGVLLALAVKDELLTLDEPLSTILEEWKSDPRRAKITYRQLLSLTSGLHPGDNGKVPSYREAVESAKSQRPPGSAFAYGPLPYQVFGEALRRKLASRDDLDFADPLAYLESRVFAKIGLSYETWRRDVEGMPHLPSGASLAAPEWAKFGEFLRLEGTWEGEPLVDRETLLNCFEGSKANPGYGLTFWRIQPGAESTTDNAPGAEQAEASRGNRRSDPRLAGAYMAAGAGKQRLYVIPALDLVIVRQGESRQFSNEILFTRLLGKTSPITPGSDPSR